MYLVIGRTTGPALNLSWPEDFDVIGVTDDKTLAVMVAHDKNVENGHDDEGDVRVTVCEGETMNRQKLPKRIVLRAYGLNVTFVRCCSTSSGYGYDSYVFNGRNVRCALSLIEGRDSNYKNYTRVIVTLASKRGSTCVNGIQIRSDSSRRYNWALSNDRLERAIVEQLLTCMLIASERARMCRTIVDDVESFVDMIRVTE